MTELEAAEEILRGPFKPDGLKVRKKFREACVCLAFFDVLEEAKAESMRRYAAALGKASARAASKGVR